MAIGGGLTNQANMAEMFALQAQDMRNRQLLEGVRSGDINRREFLNLAVHQNGTAEQMNEALFSRPRETFVPQNGAGMANQAAMIQMQAQDMAAARDQYQILGERSQGYEALYQKYTHGDYQPATVPRDRIDAAQQRHLSQIYAGVRDGSLTPDQALQAMRTDQDISAQRGRLEADGHLSRPERRELRGAARDATAATQATRRQG